MKHIRPLFQQPLKTDLLDNDAIRFFLNRTPIWNGMPIPPDVNGVSPNGVLNIHESNYSPTPIVREIDRATYGTYMAAPNPGPECEALVDQIFAVIYQVRNNTMHGGKEPTSDNVITVVDNAYVLLRKIIDSFLIR